MLAAPLALAVLVGLEAAWLPAKLLEQSPANSFHAVAYLFSVAYRYLWIPLVYVLLLSIVEMKPVHRRIGTRRTAVLHLLLALAVTGHAYLVMTRYDAFAKSWMVAGAFAAACAFLSAASLTTRTSLHGWRKLVSPALLAIGGVVTVALNHVLVKDMHAELHVAAVELNLALLGVAALQFAVRDLLPLPRRPRVRLGIASLGVVLLVALPFSMFDAGKTARKYVRAKTNIGLARTISDPKALDRYRRASRVKPLEPAEALAIFDRYANLPTLPPDFELIDHDIILITVDALRWDQTSLADPSLRTTPNLVKFAKDGAFDYTRAYSPSSTTLQSMASIMAMSPPMAAHLDIWKRTWAGRLRLSAVTVAELLRGMGYATHWVGHDHRAVFTEQIIGVEQGFHSRSLVPETGRGWTSRGVDAQIAKLGVAKLDEVPIDQPLFAWFFFASPHAPYVVHNRKKPKDSDLDRYRQEVRNADRQIGHILDKLREQDRLDSSIVIITSDHGEEFGERGGERHAKSVYEEVTHVPLLIRIPELPGTKVDVPTSSIYLFPWLLRHGNEAAQEQVTKILCTRIALLMKATQGAVPVQLLGRDHHYSGLILDDTKLIYDHVHEILEVYDLAADPGETDDLSFSDPERVAQLEPLLESFLDVRAYSQNFRLQPRKTLWREQDEAWLDEKIGEQGALVPETAEVEVVKTPKKTKKRKTKKRKSKSRSKNDRVEPAKDAKPEFVQPARPKTAPNLPTAPQPQ